MPRFRLSETDEWFEFDGNKLLVKEARQLEELTGMGLADFGQGLQRGKVDAICFMIWITKRRNGQPVTWKSLDDLNLGELRMERDDAEQAAQQRAELAAEGAAERGDPPLDMAAEKGEGAPTPPTTPPAEPETNGAGPTPPAERQEDAPVPIS